jgi:hypothetical protein
MPDDGEGNFDGGGSVRWEVNTTDDDGDKFQTHTEGPKRDTQGVDKQHGSQFKIVMKVPEDGSAAAFLAQFNVAPVDGRIEVSLNRERRAKQISVQWPRNQSGS